MLKKEEYYKFLATDKYEKYDNPFANADKGKIKSNYRRITKIIDTSTWICYCIHSFEKIFPGIFASTTDSVIGKLALAVIVKFSTFLVYLFILFVTVAPTLYTIACNIYFKVNKKNRQEIKELNDMLLKYKKE